MAPGIGKKSAKQWKKVVTVLAMCTFFLCVTVATARAQCTTLPYTLTNGTPTDATQVMANFNTLLGCLPAGNVNPGTAGQVGYYATTGSAISGTSLSSILDASVGSAQGSILERGSAGWSFIAPGSAGYVLTSNGSGADPSYQAVGGGSNRGLFSGQLSATVPSSTAGWTWLNQGSSTETDSTAGMYFAVPSNGATSIARGMYVAAPTPPYTRTVLALNNQYASPNSYFIFGWYDGSAKLQTMAFANNGNQGWFTWNSATSLNAINTYTYPNVPYIFLQVADDGFNFTMSYSLDGANYQTVATGAKSGSWLGASGFSNIYVGCNCYQGNANFTIVSYQ